jgi:hypothetical protein
MKHTRTASKGRCVLDNLRRSPTLDALRGEVGQLLSVLAAGRLNLLLAAPKLRSCGNGEHRSDFPVGIVLASAAMGPKPVRSLLPSGAQRGQVSRDSDCQDSASGLCGSTLRRTSRGDTRSNS